MSGMSEWARREVKIACEEENPNRKGDEFDYGCACYESALKAFESLCKDGHSGFSIKMTQAILNRLLDGQPLTPIEDTDDIWTLCSGYENNSDVYQCKRMSSLFKNVYADGTVKYNDVDRVRCADINYPKNTYSFGLVTKIFDEMFPIAMPYMPGKPIKVYCEDFLTDEKNGDFDTVGVFYALKTENGEQKKIEINRFFKESRGCETGWIEITRREYSERKNSTKTYISEEE